MQHMIRVCSSTFQCALPVRLPKVETIVPVELCMRVNLSISCSPMAFVSRLFSTTWNGSKAGCAALLESSVNWESLSKGGVAM